MGFRLRKSRRTGSRYLWSIRLNAWTSPSALFAGSNRADIKVYGLGKKSLVSRRPFVEMCFVPYIRERIYRLTKNIIGESLEILVGGTRVSKSIVREPLGTNQTLSISEFSYGDAAVLADRLRARWSQVELKLVSREI